MIKFSKRLAAFFFRSDGAFEAAPSKERYRQFRVSLLVALTIIALFPSTLLAVLGYFRYLDLAQRQSANQIRWHLQYIRSNLEQHIEALHEAVDKTASQLLPVHFESRNHLQILLKTVQEEEQGLVHIEILDQRGKRLTSTSDTYHSEHSLQDTPWFKNAFSKGYSISDIETGSSPHFILAKRVHMESSPSELICKIVFLASFLEEMSNSVQFCPPISV